MAKYTRSEQEDMILKFFQDNHATSPNDIERGIEPLLNEIGWKGVQAGFYISIIQFFEGMEYVLRGNDGKLSITERGKKQKSSKELEVEHERREKDLYVFARDSVKFSKSAVFWSKIAAVLAVIAILISLKDCSGVKDNTVNDSQNNKQASPTL